MKKLLIATAVLLTGTGLALAQSDDTTADPTAKPMTSDLPAGAKDKMPAADGTSGGTTADPTAKPMTSDLPAGAKDEMPAADGTDGGMTADPAAKPDSSDLGSKKTND
jgi:hypothetical protein